MLQPVNGPSNPFASTEMQVRKNVWTGHVEENMFSDHDFRTQQQSYAAFGFAKDPSILTVANSGQSGAGVDGTGFVGDVEKAKIMDGMFQVNQQTFCNFIPTRITNSQR